MAGGSRGLGAIGSNNAQGGGRVLPYSRPETDFYYSDVSEAGDEGKEECSYVIDCLQKQKCDWDLFCRCVRGKCVSMRTRSSIGKRDCDTKRQVSNISFLSSQGLGLILLMPKSSAADFFANFLM